MATAAMAPRGMWRHTTRRRSSTLSKRQRTKRPARTDTFNSFWTLVLQLR
jgi:hypothetical protein